MYEKHNVISHQYKTQSMSIRWCIVNCAQQNVVASKKGLCPVIPHWAKLFHISTIVTDHGRNPLFMAYSENCLTAVLLNQVKTSHINHHRRIITLINSVEWGIIYFVLNQLKNIVAFCKVSTLFSICKEYTIPPPLTLTRTIWVWPCTT